MQHLTNNLLREVVKGVNRGLCITNIQTYWVLTMLSIILPINILIKYVSYAVTMSLINVMEEVGISGESHRPVYKQFAKPITLCFIKFISARNRINGLHTNYLASITYYSFFLKNLQQDYWRILIWQPLWFCNASSTRLQCSRSLVRVPVGSNSIL